MTPQYPQFELWWSTLFSVSIIPASNVSNEEAFEGGMNENSVETKDIIAAKHGIEKTGVDIRTVYIENIEEAFEENEKLVDENVEDATKHGVEKTGVEIVWMLRT